MKRFAIAALVSVFSANAIPAIAADQLVDSSIADALNSSSAYELIKNDVKLYFGNEKHPKILQVIGEWKSNRRKNMSGYGQVQSCHIAFSHAVYELQKRARQEGADAVVNIVSVDNKKNEYASKVNYVCRVGSVMTAVALQGKFVRLKK